MRVDKVKNRIPGNENEANHVRYVFEEVVPKMANPHAKLDIIGVGDGASEVVSYLQSAWETWKDRVQAIAVGTGYMWPGEEVYNADFASFWGRVNSFLHSPQHSFFFLLTAFLTIPFPTLTSLQRARAYLLSPHPLDTPLSGREDFGCNCYSSGEAVHTECIMPRAHRSMLAFFQLVNDVPGYQEVEAFLPMDEEGDGNGNENGGGEGGGKVEEEEEEEKGKGAEGRGSRVAVVDRLDGREVRRV